MGCFLILYTIEIGKCIYYNKELCSCREEWKAFCFLEERKKVKCLKRGCVLGKISSPSIQNDFHYVSSFHSGTASFKKWFYGGAYCGELEVNAD